MQLYYIDYSLTRLTPSVNYIILSLHTSKVAVRGYSIKSNMHDAPINTYTSYHAGSIVSLFLVLKNITKFFFVI